MKDKEYLIKEFIKSIKQKFYGFSFLINYDFNEDSNDFYIWHNSNELQFENDNFREFVSDKMEELFFSNEFYDFNFGYDKHQNFNKSSELNNLYDGFNFGQITFINDGSEAGNEEYVLAA